MIYYVLQAVNDTTKDHMTWNLANAALLIGDNEIITLLIIMISR